MTSKPNSLLRPAVAFALVTLLAGRPMLAAAAVEDTTPATALPSAPQPALRLPHFTLPPSPADPGIVGPLTITILEGEGALNNIRQRTAREPIVQVEDKNHKRVNGGYVTFTIQPSVAGAGATFAGGLTALTVALNDQGQATAAGLLPNGNPGTFTITVVVTVGTLTGTIIITQTNVTGAPPGSQGTNNLLHIHHFWVWTIIGGAVVGGTIAAIVILNNGSGTTITPGPGGVGTP